MQSINANDLNSEYTNWVKENGNGRNRQDQRFSQHIHNTYNLTNLNLQDDGFYIENAEKFYLCIIKSLVCSESRKLQTEKIR
mgnify:FL=1|tara:strand:- start:31 stop:276 length:246 start_codon:yes stop_codon:yes gene_type:complete